MLRCSRCSWGSFSNQKQAAAIGSQALADFWRDMTATGCEGNDKLFEVRLPPVLEFRLSSLVVSQACIHRLQLIQIMHYRPGLHILFRTQPLCLYTNICICPIAWRVGPVSLVSAETSAEAHSLRGSHDP